jgi:mono/diheme cytochrome c family protein
MRTNRRSRLLAELLVLTLWGCSSPTVGGSAASIPATAKIETPKQDLGGRSDLPAPAARGRAFAVAHCASCHAVGAPGISPNPEAPAFETVVNTPGLTPATLSDWLRNSHNYPDAMNLTIDADRIDELAAYMMTLRDRP